MSSGQEVANRTATRRAAARELADYHFAVEDHIERVVYYERAGGDAPHEPLKLLEVNAATVPAGVVPVLLASPSGGPPVAIIELTPAEYAELRAGRLTLPPGWDLAEEWLRGWAA
jgi:hypothetical protein